MNKVLKMLEQMKTDREIVDYSFKIDHTINLDDSSDDVEDTLKEYLNLDIVLERTNEGQH